MEGSNLQKSFSCLLYSLVWVGTCIETKSGKLTRSLSLKTIAHLHHAINQYRYGYSLQSIIASSALQFSYTWLFGCFSTLMLMQTTNVAGPIISHIFCNWMGLPDFASIIDRSAPRRSAYLACSYIIGIVIFVHFLPN